MTALETGMLLKSPRGDAWRVDEVDGEEVTVRMFGSLGNTLAITRAEIDAAAAWTPMGASR